MFRRVTGTGRAAPLQLLAGALAVWLVVYAVHGLPHGGSRGDMASPAAAAVATLAGPAMAHCAVEGVGVDGAAWGPVVLAVGVVALIACGARAVPADPVGSLARAGPSARQALLGVYRN